MKTIRGWFVASAIAAWVVPVAGLGQAANPSLLIEKERVRVEQVAPGSRWLLLAYGRELSSPVSVRGYFQWHSVEDRGRSGRVELDLAEAPSPNLALWAAYEVATGRLLTARPEGEPPPRREQSLSPEQAISLVNLGASEALLFVLRRGAGGWVWTGEADNTTPALGTPAVLLPQPEHFIAISDVEPVLLDYRAGDLFLAIDQRTLALTVSRLP